MTDQKRVYTDPAREMADLLGLLLEGNVSLSGGDFLAQKFGVEPWSQDFLRIITVLMGRLDALKSIVAQLETDDDILAEMIAHVDDIGEAFSLHSLQGSWNTFGLNKVGGANIRLLRNIAGQVRKLVPYPKVSEEEVETLIGEVDVLLTWLHAHQLVEHDFIRHALIEGLGQLRFRLQHLRWLGWEYAIDGLKQVIAAYVMLEREEFDVGVDPNTAAILSRVGTVIQSVYGKVEKAKDVAEVADWLLRAFGAQSLLYGAPTIIRGLLGAP